MNYISSVMTVTIYSTNMNTINITVKTKGNITNYEIARAIENRRELLENKAINYPPIKNKKVDMKVDRVTAHSFFSKILP